MTEPFPLQTLQSGKQPHGRSRAEARRIDCQWPGRRKTRPAGGISQGISRRFVEAARNGIGPDAWRNFNAFLGKLDDAISLQQRVVSDSKQRTEQGQQAWVDQRNKVKASTPCRTAHQSQQARKETNQEQASSRTNTPPSNSRSHRRVIAAGLPGTSLADWPMSASSPGTPSCPDRP